MASKTKGRASSTSVTLVVRRGATRRFRALKQKTADLQVSVSWDRRKIERRDGQIPTDIERRKTDRRKQPPFTWETADFVVVAEPSQGKRRS
jgi:hypothetical protein